MKSLFVIMVVVPILMISLGSVYAIPLVDEFVKEEIKNTNMTTSTNNQTTADHVPKFFAIQYAQSGSLSEINDTAYSLELIDVSNKTILFSDRPDRIVKSVSTSNFIDNWSKGEDNFAVDAPNAVLVMDESEKQDNTIITLFYPVYDSNEKTLKYEVTPDNATSIELPNEFGQSTLVMDSFGPCPGC